MLRKASMVAVVTFFQDQTGIQVFTVSWVALTYLTVSVCGARVRRSWGGEGAGEVRGADAPAATAVCRRWRPPPLQVHSYTKP